MEEIRCLLNDKPGRPLQIFLLSDARMSKSAKRLITKSISNNIKSYGANQMDLADDPTTPEVLLNVLARNTPEIRH